MRSMRAAQVTGPGRLEIIDAPVPVPRAGQVLVRVIAYAPYGTDLGVYLNKDGRYVQSYPVGIGADFSGVVAELGPGVVNVAVGDRVSALALEHCGQCRHCRAGRTNVCLDPAYQSVVRQTCCQEYTLVSARKLARLPNTVGFDDAAMLTGIVDALNAFERIGIRSGEEIAVVGVGAMGLAAVATATAVGLTAVALGGTGQRAVLASRLGARAVIRVGAHGEDVADRARQLAPEGFAYVMETTASDWGVAQAIAVAGMGGYVAVTGGGALPASSWDLVRKELTLVGVRAGHHQERALELIAAGRLDLKPTVYARFPLDAVHEAFALLAGPDARDVGRIVIDVTQPPR